jgi:beta-N-acetylhexosaminidase
VSSLTPQARLAVLVAAIAIVLGGGVYLLFIRGGSESPLVEAGSRFGSENAGGGGGSVLDTLAPVLGARVRSRSSGADPAPPSAGELRRAPGDPVAGLFVIGFAGTEPTGSFFERLAARPYGGVLLSRSNYVEPSQLAKLTAHVQQVARDAGHAAPIVSAQQEGGADFSAFANLAPDAQVAVGARKAGEIRGSARVAGQQLRALGIGMNLAPNADIGVAGGPAEGRAFADTASRVVKAVTAAVEGYRRAGVAAAVGPFPGDGAASQDPAAGPAPVGLTMEQLRAGDISPFAAVAKGRAATAAMQMSNAIYTAYDSVTPATLLPDAVKELRDRLGFQGTIVSGDLVSTTATTGGSVGDAAVEALKAGVDMLLVPGGRAQQDEAYRAVVAAVASGRLSADRIVASLRRIAKLRALTRGAREPVTLDG